MLLVDVFDFTLKCGRWDSEINCSKALKKFPREAVNKTCLPCKNPTIYPEMNSRCFRSRPLLCKALFYPELLNMCLYNALNITSLNISKSGGLGECWLLDWGDENNYIL